MLNVVLVEPEIPMNTGNIARTCAATGVALHLIHPLGFDISEKAVKRAGLDYWDMLNIYEYASLEDFFQKHPQPDLWLATTKAPQRYSDVVYQPDCFLFFGKETAGLPQDFIDRYPDRGVRLPMLPSARSLNLANAVAVMTYEALRQMDFPTLSADGPGAWQLQKEQHFRK